MSHHIALNETGEVRNAEGQTVGYFVPAIEYEKLQNYREVFLWWARKQFSEEDVKRLAEELVNPNLDDYYTLDEILAGIEEKPDFEGGSHVDQR